MSGCVGYHLQSQLQNRIGSSLIFQHVVMFCICPLTKRAFHDIFWLAGTNWQAPNNPLPKYDLSDSLTYGKVPRSVLQVLRGILYAAEVGCGVLHKLCKIRLRRCGRKSVRNMRTTTEKS